MKPSTHTHTHTILVWIQWTNSFKLLRFERLNDMAYERSTHTLTLTPANKTNGKIIEKKNTSPEVWTRWRKKYKSIARKQNQTKPNQINKKKPNKWFFDGRLQRQSEIMTQRDQQKTITYTNRGNLNEFHTFSFSLYRFLFLSFVLHWI